jgi:outer membrane autotransporter protein
MKETHLLTDGSRSQKRKARRLIQCAMAGAALSLALYPSVSRADVNLSPYDNYDITQHTDGGFANPIPGYGFEDSETAVPLTDFENGVYNGALYKLLTVDIGTATNGSEDHTYDTSLDSQLNGQNHSLSLRQALGIANHTGTPTIIYFNSGGTDGAGITSNVENNYLLGTNGPIVIDNPNANILIKSHNYFVPEVASSGWPTPGPNAKIEINAGKVLFYATLESPAYAQFPISIGGSGSGTNSGQVEMFVTRNAGYTNGKQPIINILNMSSYGSFKGNRYIRFNFNLSGTPLTLHDNSQLEFGQHNTIYDDIDLYDQSTFVSNGGNTFFYYGNAGDGSQNVLNKDLNLYDSSNAVLGYKTTISGNLNVGTETGDTPTVRLLGPSTVAHNATFGSGSTIVASLNTPITDAGDNANATEKPGHPKVPDYSDSAYNPDSVGNIRALLTVVGALTVNDGAKLVIDSVNSNSLHVGDKYLVFTSSNQSGLLNLNNNISTSLTPLTFSDLLNDPENTNNYYVEITGISFANSFDDVTGGNKEQRSFFNYVRDIAPEDDLPGNVNATLLYLYNNIGAGPDYNYNIANQFLGDSYTAHAAQLYWNQKAFIEEISSNLGNQRNMNSGQNSFNLAGSSFGNVQGKLFSLRQSLNTPALGFAGALNANGNNGVSNRGVWADAYGGRVNTDASDSIGSPDWDGSTTGFAAGYTGGSNHFNWGVAAGHQKSDLDFNDRDASGKIEGYNLGLYAALNHKKSYLNGILSYSHFDNDASRNDAIGDNSSSFKSHGLAAQLEYGIHVRQTKSSELTPYASLLWTNSDIGDITEEGTGAGLSLDGDSNSVVTSQLGVRYNHRTYDKSDNLKGGLQAGVAWVHQFGDTDFPMTAQFTGTTGNWNIYNTPLSSNALQVQLGAYGRIHNNVIGFANYQGTFGDNEKVHTVTAGLGYQF